MGGRVSFRRGVGGWDMGCIFLWRGLAEGMLRDGLEGECGSLRVACECESGHVRAKNLDPELCPPASFGRLQIAPSPPAT